VLSDLRFAVRGLVKTKGWTLVVLLSLAIGIGANMTLFTVVNGLLFRTVPVRDPQALVRLRWTGPNDALTSHSEYGSTRPDAGGHRTSVAFSYPMYQQLVRANQSLSDLIVCAPFGRVNVVVDGQADIARAFISSGNYYTALGVRAAAGRLLLPSDDSQTAPPAVVISHRFWQSRFGGRAGIVGTLIRVNDVPVTVVGVIAPEFTGIQLPMAEAPDIGVPMALEGPISGVSSAAGQVSGSTSGPGITLKSNSSDPTNWWLEMVGRLKPGVTASQVQANLGPVFQQTARANLDQYLAGLTETDRSSADNASRKSIPQLIVESGARGVYDSNRDTVSSATLLMAAVGVVLLIVCANTANLLLSRAATRHREIAIRLSMGATRRRLIRQLLTESLVLAGAGGCVGILIGYFGRQLVPDTLGPPSPIDATVILFVAGVAILTGVLFGLAPAFTATRVSLNTTMKEQGRGVVGSRRWLGKTLLVAQVALALVLLVGAALFIRTTDKLRRVDVGFNATNLLLVSVNPRLNHYDLPRTFTFYENLLRDLRMVPGVRHASLSQPALLSGSTNIGDVFFQSRTYERGRNSDSMNRVVVSPGFFETLGMTIVDGRGPNDRDIEGAPVVAIVNEAAMREYFNGRSPVGQRFGDSFEDRSRFEIVGVVRDAKYNSLREPAPPTMYLPLRQTKTQAATLEIRTAGPPNAIVGQVRELVRRADPNLPLMNVTTQMEAIEGRFQQERLFSQAYTLFGALALLVAAIGLFGVMSYSVARRTGEIGIRMALGAQRRGVLGLVMRESLTLVAIGVAVGIAGAIAAGRVVNTYLFGLEPTDVGAISSAVAVMLTVSILAAFLPARRASKVDPLIALRSE
jgi:predicted permease